MVRVEIGENEQGRRLDRFLKKYLRSAPLSFIYRVIRKDVKVNGKRAGADTLLAVGDVVEIYLPEEQVEGFLPQREGMKARKQFEIIYEDEAILVVNKPFGLLTHGDGKEKKNTLANQVIAYLIETGSYAPGRTQTFTPAPANRLDRNTTGLVMFGKTLSALRDMTAMIRGADGENGAQSVGKYYLTVVKGTMKEKLCLTNRMTRDRERGVTVVLPEGAAEGILMETEARPLSAGKGYTLAEAKLITGRTHQIRAHLAEAGFPVVGDRKYGDAAANHLATRRFGLTTQLLHAYRIEIAAGRGSLDYLGGKRFEAAPPAGFVQIAEGLGCRLKLKK
ncbi:MAG: RluA family pseudouridine synthase [Clostridiales Family XIII bacterium]|jgi:23S rRNA pseudouridine955/2504/2580 synthase|nr:RluA family pseudouridine synthase [Clostridiales Family XIII bacterium]